MTTAEDTGIVEMAWDPITRIVGSLGIYTKIDFNQKKVVECHSTSSIFRGYSIFMKGKDPRDAHFITSRICGICGDNHATCSVYNQNMAYGVRPPHLGEWIINLGEAAEYMFDHNIFQENLVGVDFCERMVSETNPGVLELANRTEAPHAAEHGYATIGDIMRSLNPLEGEFYREALQVSRSTREMFCLMEGRHVHPSTLYPGGVGTTATVQLFTDYLTRLMRYVEFMKRVVPLHDDLFDFFYEAMPGYEEVGRRRADMVCWGSLNDPEYCDFTYRNMTNWGRKMFVSPGVIRDGELLTNDLVEINLGIRILLGSSYYEDWEDQEMFVTHDPLGNPVDRRHPWNQHTIPRPQKRNFEDKYSWVMSPRWFDGTNHLAADTGGGPIARLWATALGGLVDFGYVKSTGHSVQINLPRTVSKPEVTFEWKIPADKEGRPLSNAIERDRARTYFQAYAAACALHFTEQALAEIRAGRHQDVGAVHRPGRGVQLRVHRGGARRAVAPHGDPRREDRELPPVPADPVERERAGRLRDAGTLRGRRAEHPDLRGEPAGELQGHRHHARGAQLRPVPAVRRAHVPRRRPGAGQGALADVGRAGHLGSSMTRVKQAGDRIEEILGLLRSGDAAAAAAAEELVGLLVGLYGDGLGHIVAALRRRGTGRRRAAGQADRGPAGREPAAAARPAPAGRGRPDPAGPRPGPALPGLARGRGRVPRRDRTGVARLRLEGSCHGCPSSTVTVRLAIEDAVKDAAPEVSEVAVEGMTDPPPASPALLQIGPGLAAARRAAARRAGSPCRTSGRPAPGR